MSEYEYIAAEPIIEPKNPRQAAGGWEVDGYVTFAVRAKKKDAPVIDHSFIGEDGPHSTDGDQVASVSAQFERARSGQEALRQTAEQLRAIAQAFLAQADALLKA